MEVLARQVLNNPVEIQVGAWLWSKDGHETVQACPSEFPGDAWPATCTGGPAGSGASQEQVLPVNFPGRRHNRAPLPSCPAAALQVGGRSVVNKDITQYVEIRPEEDRFLRLLEVLGEW